MLKNIGHQIVHRELDILNIPNNYNVLTKTNDFTKIFQH